jgi:hypothetical protein
MVFGNGKRLRVMNCETHGLHKKMILEALVIGNFSSHLELHLSGCVSQAMDKIFVHISTMSKFSS